MPKSTSLIPIPVKDCVYAESINTAIRACDIHTHSIGIGGLDALYCSGCVEHIMSREVLLVGHVGGMGVGKNGVQQIGADEWMVGICSKTMARRNSSND